MRLELVSAQVSACASQSVANGLLVIGSVNDYFLRGVLIFRLLSFRFLLVVVVVVVDHHLLRRRRRHSAFLLVVVQYFHPLGFCFLFSAERVCQQPML